MIDNFPAAYTELAFGVLAILMCSTIWVVIKVGAWLLSVYPVRAEAVVEWQDCDVKDRPDWDHDEVEVIAQLVMAPAAEEETEEDVDDFRLWAREVSMQRGIRRHLKRMERLP